MASGQRAAIGTITLVLCFTGLGWQHLSSVQTQLNDVQRQLTSNSAEAATYLKLTSKQLAASVAQIKAQLDTNGKMSVQKRVQLDPKTAHDIAEMKEMIAEIKVQPDDATKQLATAVAQIKAQLDTNGKMSVQETVQLDPKTALDIAKIKEMIAEIEVLGTLAIEPTGNENVERSDRGTVDEGATRSTRSGLQGQAPRCTYPRWLNRAFNPDSGSCPWDGKEVITSSNPTQQCLWTTFKDGGKQARMCVHPSDAVSGSVVHNGRWADCDRLAPMWRKQLNPAFGENKIYLELGGNIGSCLMHMLLLTDARLVVFEPNPKNLFCITSTLLGLNAGLRQRVALFPFAVGDQIVSDALINAAVGNLGNSAIGASVQDDSKQTFYPPDHIQIKTVDSLNVVGHLDIPLMKMDIQGFECKALVGMPQTLSRVRSISTEVARRWLQAQNCTESELFNILEGTGFSVSARQTEEVYDIQAIRDKSQN